MEKKSIWVVTLVVVRRVSLSVDTYALGWFNSFDEATSFLEIEYSRLCRLGYEPSRFLRNGCGWTYMSEFVMSQVIICLATAG